MAALSAPWTRSRRTRMAVLAAPAAALAAWAPSFVAEIYDGDGHGGAPHGAYLGNPVRGWEFLADAVRLSRGTPVGTSDSALERARGSIWAGPPVVAERVTLLHVTRPFRVAIPAGGVAPGPGRRVARPRSGLSWLVEGRVGGRPLQPIGLLDYGTGRVAWDIRPLPGGRR